MAISEVKPSMHHVLRVGVWHPVMRLCLLWWLAVLYKTPITSWSWFMVDLRDTAVRLSQALVNGLDDLFPRPWLVAWREAQANGWRPDDPQHYCARCGYTIHETAQLPGGCAFCVNQTLPWRSVTRLCAYGEPMSRWVHELKFRRQWSWANVLGQSLGQTIRHKHGEPVDVSRTLICPVPLHPWRRLHRGYNQSQLIAKAVGRECGLEVLPLLKRVKLRPPQSTLPLSARKANVRRVFAMKDVDLTGHTVWLVDDVKTSGATTRACCRLLKRAGASHVDLMVLAVADPKGGRFQRL